MQVIDKEVAQGGLDMASRPGWLGSTGADVMTSDEAKAYVQYWNAQDLANIDINSPEWTKFAAFVSDPENQAAVAYYHSQRPHNSITEVRLITFGWIAE